MGLQTRGTASNEGSILMSQSDEQELEEEPGEQDTLARPQVTLEHDDGQTWVTLTGEIDLAAGADLDNVAEQAIVLACPVVVDISQVTFMDSIGVGFIARLVIAGQRSGWRPLLRGAQGPVLETLTVSGLLAEIDLAPS
jgi:anti-sigma B factor antagonist